MLATSFPSGIGGFSADGLSPMASTQVSCGVNHDSLVFGDSGRARLIGTEGFVAILAAEASRHKRAVE
jgi:hypothetical protein